MKKLLKTFALVAVAVVGTVSCTENMVDDTIAPSTTGGVTLLATTPSEETQTKVEFADNGDDGISLSWSEGDTFTLYKGDVKIDTFTTELGNGSFTSSNEDLTLESGTEYTAKYNEEATTAEQDGDEINNLDNACQMEASFTYGTDTSIAFAHTMAIMTFQFESAERPAYLIFENGTESYKVTYTALEPVNNIYTSHIMINPCEGIERTLTFSLYNSEGTAYDVRTTTTSKEYKKGYRYTAPVSGLDPTIWLGSGTEDDPYQISTADQLRELATKVNAGTTYQNEYFVMTCDIDLDGSESNQFTPIGQSGSSFKGAFDGSGYCVSELYINNSSNYQGLFGSVAAVYDSGTHITYPAVIKNLRVSGSVTGGERVGGIVGSIGGISGSLTNISTVISNCYSDVSVSGTSGVGGIVGYAYYCWISNCGNEGSVEGSTGNIGGIAGCHQYGILVNSYNIGSVEGESSDVSCIGGIVGLIYNDSDTTLNNCYSAGEVSGEGSKIGGIVGSVYGSVQYGTANPKISNCYYNTDNYSGDAFGVYDEYAIISDYDGYSTAVMQSGSLAYMLNKNACTYNEDSPAFAAYEWEAVSGDYPTLDVNVASSYTEVESCTAFGLGTESSPYVIVSGAQLRDLSTSVNNKNYYSDNYFQMVCDIDLGGIDDEGNGVTENEFTRIGYYGETSSLRRYFAGTFDGGGHEVSGLYIFQSDSDYQGLFGYASGATIKNLGVSGNVTGGSYVGCIVGYNYSTVINCHSSGSVTGTSRYVGGVVGYNYASTVSGCCNSCTVTGATNYVGGIVGSNSASLSKSPSSVINCYNSGLVKGESDSSQYIGGVVGTNSSSTVSNCYNTGTVEGYNYIGGVAGESYTSSSSSTLSYCYNTGSVTGSGTRVGGVVGCNYSSASTVSNCIYDSSVYTGDAIGEDSGTSTDNSGSDTLIATMKGGSFSATLGIDNWKEDYTEQINSGYPILIWQ